MTAAYRGTPRRRPVPVPAVDDAAGAGFARLMERRAAVVLAEAPTTDDAMLRLLARREAAQLKAAGGGDGSSGPLELTDSLEAVEPVEADPTAARLLARRAGSGLADGATEGMSDVARLLARREEQAEPAPAAGDDELTRLLSRRAWTDTATDMAEASEMERLLARRTAADRPAAEPENADPALARLLARRADTEE